MGRPLLCRLNLHRWVWEDYPRDELDWPYRCVRGDCLFRQRLYSEGSRRAFPVQADPGSTLTVHSYGVQVLLLTPMIPSPQAIAAAMQLGGPLMPTLGADAPLYAPEPEGEPAARVGVEGWRTATIVGDGVLLGARGAPLTEDVSPVAWCDQSEHAAPDWGCEPGCGYHALFACECGPQGLNWHDAIVYVSAVGRTLIAEHGWRAERIQVEAIYVKREHEACLLAKRFTAPIYYFEEEHDADRQTEGSGDRDSEGDSGTSGYALQRALKIAALAFDKTFPAGGTSDPLTPDG